MCVDTVYVYTICIYPRLHFVDCMWVDVSCVCMCVYIYILIVCIVNVFAVSSGAMAWRIYCSGRSSVNDTIERKCNHNFHLRTIFRHIRTGVRPEFDRTVIYMLAIVVSFRVCFLLTCAVRVRPRCPRSVNIYRTCV